jgi:hypothetical protein
MSIETFALLMVGLPYDELKEVIGEKIDDLVDESLYVGTYKYDSPPEDNIVGYKVARGNCINVDQDIENVGVLKNKFLLEFGVKAKLFLTLQIY